MQVEHKDLVKPVQEELPYSAVQHSLDKRTVRDERQDSVARRALLLEQFSTPADSVRRPGLGTAVGAPAGDRVAGQLTLVAGVTTWRPRACGGTRP